MTFTNTLATVALSCHYVVPLCLIRVRFVHLVITNSLTILAAISFSDTCWIQATSNPHSRKTQHCRRACIPNQQVFVVPEYSGPNRVSDVEGLHTRILCSVKYPRVESGPDSSPRLRSGRHTPLLSQQVLDRN